MKLTATIHFTLYTRESEGRNPTPETMMDFLISFLAHETRTLESLECIEEGRNISAFKISFKPKQLVTDLRKYRLELEQKIIKFQENRYQVFNVDIRIGKIEYNPREWSRLSALRVLANKLDGT